MTPPPPVPDDPDADDRLAHAGTVYGWPGGYLTGPAMFLLWNVAEAGFNLDGLEVFVGLACVVVAGSFLAPLGQLGADAALIVRDRRSADWPTGRTAFVGSFSAGAAIWPVVAIVWAVWRPF